MRFGINTLDDIDVSGKTVLCRIDINQPVDHDTGTLRDTTRIQACVPTLQELSEKGAKLVLIAHQGSDIEYENFYTTQPHSVVLSEIMGKEVKFIADVCGPAAIEAIKNLGSGEILLLDNVRYMSEEQTLFELKLKLTHEQQAKTLVVQKLAPLADYYVCDAFAAAHRDQPSLCGFEQVLPSAMGRLFEEEFCVISSLMEKPKRKCVFILGGSKITDAFMMMSAVLGGGTADVVLTGGLVGQVLLWADGVDIGAATRGLISSKGYEHLVATGRELLQKFRDKIMLPLDLAGVCCDDREEHTISEIPQCFNAVDIGSETIKAYVQQILSAGTVFANGPVGVFEKELSSFGTKGLWEAMGATEAYTVIGGGDSITAAKLFDVKDKMNYVCTGGGALIRFLTGEELPVVKALRFGSNIKEMRKSRL